MPKTFFVAKQEKKKRFTTYAKKQSTEALSSSATDGSKRYDAHVASSKTATSSQVVNSKKYSTYKSKNKGATSVTAAKNYTGYSKRAASTGLSAQPRKKVPIQIERKAKKDANVIIKTVENQFVEDIKVLTKRVNAVSGYQFNLTGDGIRETFGNCITDIPVEKMFKNLLISNEVGAEFQIFNGPKYNSWHNMTGGLAFGGEFGAEGIKIKYFAIAWEGQVLALPIGEGNEPILRLAVMKLYGGLMMPVDISKAAWRLDMGYMQDLLLDPTSLDFFFKGAGLDPGNRGFYIPWGEMLPDGTFVPDAPSNIPPSKPPKPPIGGTGSGDGEEGGGGGGSSNGGGVWGWLKGIFGGGGGDDPKGGQPPEPGYKPPKEEPKPPTCPGPGIMVWPPWNNPDLEGMISGNNIITITYRVDSNGNFLRDAKMNNGKNFSWVLNSIETNIGI